MASSLGQTRECVVTDDSRQLLELHWADVVGELRAASGWNIQPIPKYRRCLRGMPQIVQR